MRISDIIVEGVDIKSTNYQAAYMVAVAEAYHRAPQLDPSAKAIWDNLAEHTREVLFKRMKGSGIDIQFVPDDPYEIGSPEDSVKYLLYDIVINKRMMVYTGFSDNHPTFSYDDNIMFRAVHDFFAHASVRKAFSASMSKAAKSMKLAAWPALEDAGDLLSQVRLPSHMFNARGEFNSASEHVRLAPKEAAPALFTEIVGQVCFQVICGNFPVQKVAILKGFDYQNIGRCSGEPERRLQEVLAAIEGGEEEIALALPRKSISVRELVNSAGSHKIG